MREARSIADPAGNEKLCKATEGGRRLRARDDAVAAAILAVAEGSRRGAMATSRGLSWDRGMSQISTKPRAGISWRGLIKDRDGLALLRKVRKKWAAGMRPSSTNRYDWRGPCWTMGPV